MYIQVLQKVYRRRPTSNGPLEFAHKENHKWKVESGSPKWKNVH